MTEDAARHAASRFTALLADLREVEGLYNRDRVHHQTANQIERIFDKWLYDEPTNCESRSPDGDGQARQAGDAASSQGSSSGRDELLRDAPHADRSDAAGFESQPTLSNNYADVTKANDSTDVSQVREGLSGDNLRGQAGSSGNMQSGVCERAEAADSGRVEGSTPRQKADGLPGARQSAGSSRQSVESGHTDTSAVRDMREDGSSASRGLRQTAGGAMALPEAPQGTGQATRTHGELAKPADSHQKAAAERPSRDSLEEEIEHWLWDAGRDIERPEDVRNELLRRVLGAAGLFHRVKEDLADTATRIVQLERERDEARRYGERLYAECAGNARQVTCVYCGHEFAEGVPASQDEQLTAHIRVCEKHPLRAAEARAEAAEKEDR
jgi:hypothetical protein